MHDYRKAVSEEELEKVDQFKYNNNFENFVDPKVLKYFTKSTKSVKKAWKKTYGFPSVTLISWDGKNISPSNKVFQKMCTLCKFYPTFFKLNKLVKQ